MPARRLALATLLVVLSAGTLSACTGSTPDPASCVPRVQVAPRTAHPGDSIRIWTDDHCRLHVPAGGWVVGASNVGSDRILVRTSIQPAGDGSFSVSLVLPPDMRTGTAYAGIRNWDYSHCKDTDASCAGPMATFSVVTP